MIQNIKIIRSWLVGTAADLSALIVISIKTFDRNNVMMQALFSGMNSSYIRTRTLRIVILYNYF